MYWWYTFCMTDTISKILKYEKEGCYFHASPNPDITVLEPRQASDVTDEKFNSDLAVYASNTSQTCIKGIVSAGHNLNGVWGIFPEKENTLVAKIPKSWKSEVEKSTGFLYILPSESFTTDNPGNWQVKSNTSVKPIDKIHVTFNDFIALGGEVIWTEE